MKYTGRWLDCLKTEGFDFIRMDAGAYEFGMKCEDIPESTPRISVRISSGFYVSRNLVTQRQWVSVMGDGQYASADCMKRAANEGARHVVWGEDFPAVYITREEALRFCQRLSERCLIPVRLPTDAEWEIACRGKTNTKWFWGDEYDKILAARYAWFGQSPRTAILERVGQLQPNSVGLHDMAGLVSEWVMDQVHIGDDMMPDPRQYSDGMVDPLLSGGEYEISRGGSIKSSIFSLMSSAKSCHRKGVANGDIGFRVVIRDTMEAL